MTMSASPDAPWALVDLWDSVDQAEGQTFIVDVTGFGRVRIERWYTQNTSGVDVYDVVGSRSEAAALEAHLGEDVYDYLTVDWIDEVAGAYFAHLDLVRLNQIKDDAVEQARRVAVEPPSGGDE